MAGSCLIAGPTIMPSQIATAMAAAIPSQAISIHLSP